jgi:hypothetical protein
VRWVSEGSYDDLPDADVRVLLAVPLTTARPSAPLVAESEAAIETAAPHMPPDLVVPPPMPRAATAVPRVPTSHRGQRRRRERSAMLDTVVVGLLAAGIVLVVVMVLLVVSDRVSR